MTEPDTYETLDRIGDPDDDAPVLDPSRLAVMSHLDADEADLIEQFLEVPEDQYDA